MKDIIIIDDVIPESSQILVENQILHHDFPWCYASGISKGDGSDKNSGFSNLVYSDAKNFEIKNEIAFKLLLPIVYIGVKKAYEKNIAALKRIRLGMFIKNQNGKKFHLPHIDQEFFHYAMLYYVTDSDGPTTFFDDLLIREKVEPKRGRCVIFDGSIYHSSACPEKHDRRVTCNYNFLL